MSKYTTEVRFICEQQAGLHNSVDYYDIADVIERSRKRIFDFPYPIFDENYKPVIETKILMHYYTREISEETYGLWKLRLRTKLNEIMPYYNQLYKSELIEFNPLWDTDLTTDRDVKQDNVHEDETVTDNTTGRTIKDVEENGGQDVRTLGGEDVSVSHTDDVNKLSGMDVDTTHTDDINRLSGADVVTLDGQDVNTLGGEDVRSLDGQDVVSLGGEDVTTGHSNDVTNTWDLYSDTPQGSINGIEGAEDSPSLGDNGYLTNARHVIGDTDGSESDSTVEYGRSETTDYGRSETTDYGRSETFDYGKETSTEYGKVSDTDIDRVDTVEYGKISDTDVDKRESVEYGKVDTLEYGKNRSFDRTDDMDFDGNVKNDGTSRDTIDYLERVTGYRGRTGSESLLKFRETFLNIDEMILRDLRNLFFNLW